MITLLGSILGFISSLFPELLNIFKDRRDKKHELEILHIQIEREKQGIQGKLEEVQIKAITQETKALLGTYKTGIEWVDALNGTVRPVLAYAFFALYATVKLLAWYKFSQTSSAPAFMLYESLWTEEDSCIFAGIISFYFGSRAMQKRR